jgi:hypothetical protein
VSAVRSPEAIKILFLGTTIKKLQRNFSAAFFIAIFSIPHPQASRGRPSAYVLDKSKRYSYHDV